MFGKELPSSGIVCLRIYMLLHILIVLSTFTKIKCCYIFIKRCDIELLTM